MPDLEEVFGNFHCVETKDGVEVSSETDPNKTYWVSEIPQQDLFDRSIMDYSNKNPYRCSCPAYKFGKMWKDSSKQCKHIRKAIEDKMFCHYDTFSDMGGYEIHPNHIEGQNCPICAGEIEYYVLMA